MGPTLSCGGALLVRLTIFELFEHASICKLKKGKPYFRQSLFVCVSARSLAGVLVREPTRLCAAVRAPARMRGQLAPHMHVLRVLRVRCEKLRMSDVSYVLELESPKILLSRFKNVRHVRHAGLFTSDT